MADETSDQSPCRGCVNEKEKKFTNPTTGKEEGCAPYCLRLAIYQDRLSRASGGAYILAHAVIEGSGVRRPTTSRHAALS